MYIGVVEIVGLSIGFYELERFFVEKVFVG